RMRSGLEWPWSRIGVDVRSVRHAERGILRDLLGRSMPVAVLDVGASRGQFYRLVRSVGFRGRVISFEPIASLHAELTEHAKVDSDWVIAPRMAVGCATGLRQSMYRRIWPAAAFCPSCRRRSPLRERHPTRQRKS